MIHSILLTILSTLLSGDQDTFIVEFDTRITYNLSYILDSTMKDKVNSETMYLLINDERSLFESKYGNILDSLKFISKSQNLPNQPLSLFDYKIIKSDHQILIYESFMNDRHYNPDPVDIFQYVETPSDFKWILTEDTITYNTAVCQIAHLDYGNRKWVAYFDLNIPIFDGPYKFCGLPGLIVHIHDLKEEWVFDLVGIERKSKKFQSSLTPIKNAKIFPKMEYFNKKRDFFDNNFEIRIAQGLRFPNDQQKQILKSNYEDYKKRNSNWIELYP